ncbi:hypothetical protein Tco_0739774 [Tanacetum coccineum]
MGTILALSYPSSNNQLEISSNLMHQVAMPGRQTLSYVGNCSTGIQLRIDQTCNFGRLPVKIIDIWLYVFTFHSDNYSTFQADGVECAGDWPSSEPFEMFVNHSETEITSDSNIIPYSQFVTELQQAAVQNPKSSAQ